MISKIKHYTNKEKEQLIKQLFHYYHSILLQKENFGEEQLTRLDTYYLSTFRYSLAKLSATEKQALIFTVSDISEYEILSHGYSRSSYYRIRSNAMSKFLNCLHS